MIEPTPGPDCENGAVSSFVLEPLPASRRPFKPLHELVCVVVEAVYSLFLGVKAFNFLLLKLCYHLKHVASIPLKDRKQ
jgi:hypothetical protein